MFSQKALTFSEKALTFFRTPEFNFTTIKHSEYLSQIQKEKKKAEFSFSEEFSLHTYWIKIAYSNKITFQFPIPCLAHFPFQESTNHLLIIRKLRNKNDSKVHHSMSLSEYIYSFWIHSLPRL